MSLSTSTKRGLLPLTFVLMTLMAVFNASAQVFFSDFNSGVPAGTSIPAGPAGDANEARVDGGFLKLTDAINGVGGIYYIDDFTHGPITRFTATFKASVFGSVCCGGGTLPADGFSFNLVPAATVAVNPAYGVPAEEGLNEGLAVNFDTWDNGGGEAPSIEVKWLGTVVPGSRLSIQPSQSPLGVTDPLVASKDVFINLDPDGKITVTYGGVVVCKNLQTPYDASVIGTAKWVLGARTGGANDNHWIDNLRIVTVAPDVALLAPTATWAFNDTTLSTTSLHGTGWEGVAYDTNSAPGWKNGEALFGNDSAGLYDTAAQPFAGRGINGFTTLLDRLIGGTAARVTFFFRAKFNWSGPVAGVTLTTRNWVDDGIIAYLNGTETYRLRMPAGPVDWTTLGSNPPTEGAPEDATWNGGSLVQGENVVAVELHQSGAGSSDAAFAMSLSARPAVPVTISDPTEPADRVVFASRTATLRVSAYGSPAPTYRWFKDGVAIDPLVNATATSSSFVIPIMQASDAGAYYCTVANSVGSVNSRTATIGYLNDTSAPVVVRATANATFDKVVVEFDELIDPASAQDPFNVTITSALGDATITGVAPNAGGRSMTVIVEPVLTENTVYTVTVVGVRDLTGNEIAANNSAEFRTFVVGPGGGILFESFLGIAGNLATDLTGHPNFPNNPSDRIAITGFNSRQAYPDDSHETYGARMRGLFIPPVSGNWVFYMAADDGSQLLFNPAGPNAAGRQVLLTRNACCGDYSSVNSKAAPQALTAGQGYYIEMLYKEGGGGDWGQVAAVLEGQPVPPLTEFIPGSQLGVPSAPAGVGGVITISQQPASLDLLENRTFAFSVVASNPNGLPLFYQWRRDGVDIPGATKATYSGVATLADSGAQFSVQIVMIGNIAVSAPASLTVQQDTFAPLIVGANADDSLKVVVVKFDELIDAATAIDPFNYSVEGGPGVQTAAVGPDGASVQLTLSGLLTEDHSYTVTVGGVYDRASVPNGIASGSSAAFRTFGYHRGFLNFSVYNGTAGPAVAGVIGGNSVADLIGHPSFPGFPSERLFTSAFDTRTTFPNDSHEAYGGRLSGFFTPPVSGNWIFHLNADDGSKLLLNPAGPSPEGAVEMTALDLCCAAFGVQFSAPQALIAGTRYYIEALFKEGGGGDYCRVAAKLETDPTPGASLQPIPGVYLGSLVDPTGVTLGITQQPSDQTFVVASASLLAEEFTSSGGGFTVETPIAFNTPWVHDPATGSWVVIQDGAENNNPMTSILTSPELSVTKAGLMNIRFAHRYSFEIDTTRWDGGNLQVSVNGGPFTLVPNAAFSQNGYGGNTVGSGSRSTLAGQPAFTGDSPNFGAGPITSIASLGTFAVGDKVRFRFVYAGDTNTRGQFTPNWQITSVNVDQGVSGAQNVTFSVAATATRPGTPSAPIAYQWFRSSGAGFVPLAGATGPSYSLVPVIGDNGARFQVQVFTPGAEVTSSTATLTVVQPNSPPRFTKGADQTVAEDSGAQVIVDWATGITAHSVDRVPITYGSDFSSTPPGGVLAGNAAVVAGVLHLTDAVNSQTGSFATPAVPNRIDSFTATFKALIGGGTCCGDRTADGWSLSFGEIPVPLALSTFGAEEGVQGSSLVVSFDSWDNGEAGSQDNTFTAPNLDIKVGGNTIAYQAFDGPREGGRAPSGPFIIDPATVAPMTQKTGTSFAEVRVHLDPDGTLDVDFKGVRIFDNLPTGVGQVVNGRLAFAARTGGANDNHWIDDLVVTAFPVDSSSAESGQTVHFNVSNNNASLFSAQPAIDSTGTLTYTPAPNACGQALVTVVAQDDGGTLYGGRDSSAPQTFLITVSCVNDCATAGSQSVSVVTGSPKNIALLGADIESDALQFAIAQAPAHGTVVVQATTGAAIYTSAIGYQGPDSFSYTVTDGHGPCVPAVGVVTINVISANTPPTAKIVATPLSDFSPSIANKVVISADGTNGCLRLDGSLSTDVESPISDLTFAWFIEPSPLPFATGVVVENYCLELGTHTILLAVKDPQGATGTDSLTVEVISAGEAVEELIDRVNDSTVARSNKRPFIASLKAAGASADRGSLESAANQLHAFQNKVRAQVSKSNPVEAEIWIRWAQSIIDALNGGQ